ncbi:MULTISPECIES: UDP-glucose dehydrogenase family protein [unclassified Arthrobacter]|uniref:UDP-glucose dehydrogenase family protein n=1 Tax=unclassified Arthrobacter TaxID=235627 RepID=UPI002DF96DDA|nr:MULTISPECIES: UDP-glucose/GDP-mannose dehydrogenase family protein [unclassified Arthrobacter]MEC5190245.1 UDPglucose 6-dehydrogenase [Arthrobacter sp. MP_M4]MEC5202618.1 UDPglucose 6-dehydrogenase [Arthrobacter sp. MP_M7]
MRISVIGCGYLGAVHAATLASMGHSVIGIDVDAAKVDQLGRGTAPFFEPGLDELLRAGVRTGRLGFSTDFVDAARAELHFLCVGTPQSKTSDDADLSHLLAAMEALRPHLAAGSAVVGKSTVPVGTVDMLSGVLSLRPDVLLGWNPEFLRQGTAVKDSLVPDRLIYGVPGDGVPYDGVPDDGVLAAGPGAAITAVLDAAYAPLMAAGVPRLVCNFATAELIKSASNAYLATKLSFINAMAELCDATGADVHQLGVAMGLDPRIGGRYLHSGLGFGGGCLPKDIRSLRVQAAGLGVASVDRWMDVVDSINRDQRSRTVGLARDLCGGGLSGRRLTVLGAAFKPDTDDIRDSPALDVALQLASAGAQVTVTDPAAINNASLRYPQLRFEQSTSLALKGADLVLLLTEWDDYAALSPVDTGALVRHRRILDARNVLDAPSWESEGWTVRGLGRTAAASQQARGLHGRGAALGRL